MENFKIEQKKRGRKNIDVAKKRVTLSISISMKNYLFIKSQNKTCKIVNEILQIIDTFDCYYEYVKKESNDKNYKIISISVDPKIKEKLIFCAFKNNISISNLMNNIFDSFNNISKIDIFAIEKTKNY